jgi:putative phage-type endonuclease
MEMEITELIINSKIMGESENWDFIEWKKYITEIILEVYSQGDFHNYILDQIICYCLPQFNQNRFSFKKNRTSLINDRRQLHYLLSIPKGKAQKSEEWLSARHNHINASEAGQIFSKSRNAMLLYKAKPFEFKNSSSNATDHGNRFEIIAQNIYSKKIGKKIYNFESIEHPVYKFIAASPDGIDEDGDLLEIKCPITRDIKGVPKRDYWIQTQLQMEVTNLNCCKFVECKFDEYQCIEFYNEDTERDFKGVILQYHDNFQKKNIIYSEFNIVLDDLSDWINNEKQKIIEQNNENTYIEIIYWYLSKYSCFEVYRDRKWFIENLPIFQNFWDDVLKYRENGNLDSIEIKTRKAKIIQEPIIVNECLLKDEDDY